MTQVDNTPQNSRWLRFMPAFVSARLVGRHNLQAILGNSAWQVADKIIRMGVALLVGLWVARYLGPNRFGQLNYALALTSVFGAVSNFGVDSIVIRELVKFPERRDLLLGSAFVIKLTGAFLTLLIAGILVSFLRPGDKLILLLTILSAANFIFQSLPIDLYFQSKVQSKYIVLSANGGFLLMALAKVVLILVHAPLVAFAAVGLCEMVLAAAFILFAYALKNQSIWKWKSSLQQMRCLLIDSWPLVLTGISVMISMRIDQVLIGQMLNDREVGLYAAAVRISEIWYFVPIALAGSTFPALIESKKRSDEVFFNRLQHLYDVLVGLGIGVAVVMTFLSGPVIRLLYGHGYTGSSAPLKVLIWSGIPVAFGCAWSNWMLLENRTRMMFLMQVTAAIMNLGLNIVLIPRFGILGSAYATLISYWAPLIMLTAIMKSQHRTLLMLGKSLIPFYGYIEQRIKAGKLEDTNLA